VIALIVKIAIVDRNTTIVSAINRGHPDSLKKIAAEDAL
jgi:hypothetical protein